MKRVRLLRTRLRTVSFAQSMTDEERNRRMLVGAIDDDDYTIDRGWHVLSAEIVARYPSPKNKPEHRNQMDEVIGLVTEEKYISVPETTEEAERTR